MKALILEQPGTPDSLILSQQPKPQPEQGQVLIQVKAVGLNPVDYKTAQRGVEAWSFPHILGLDVAGVIIETCDTSEGLKKGDRVYYHGNLAKAGGYAEYVTAPVHILSKIPDEISFEDAAAIPCAGFTAWQILSRKNRPSAGESILIHGGAGGVGGFAIQLARHLGLKIFTTCSAQNFNAVKQLGANHPIDYKTENIIARIMELNDGRGVDMVINTVSGESATEDLEILAFGGHLACVAGLPDFSRITPFTKAISIHESALGGAHLSGDLPAQKDLARMGDEMMMLLKEKTISSMLTEVISLEKIPEALTRLSDRHVRGKIVAAL